MSDWSVGDLAVCVSPHDSWTDTITKEVSGGPEPGCVYRVTWVGDDDGYLCISFPEHPERYVARNFRKIRPDEHEACEDEFVTLLNRSKVPANA